jgi:hypothetical protein
LAKRRNLHLGVCRGLRVRGARQAHDEKGAADHDDLLAGGVEREAI